MDFNTFLIQKFLTWIPSCSETISRNKHSVELTWMQNDEPFGFLKEHLLYKIQRKNKMPPWETVYSGGKTKKTIDNLAPSHPHKFRLQVILKATSVPKLEELVLLHYGKERIVYDTFENVECFIKTVEFDCKKRMANNQFDQEETETSVNTPLDEEHSTVHSCYKNPNPWLESSWSEDTWTRTESEGSSVTCFCMAVRCGYLKQVQQMLEERPTLLNIINSTNGLTPLATAVRKGDMNMVRFLLNSGAEVDQKSLAGQTPLHEAVYSGYLQIVDLLLDSGADFQARDSNDLRVEHYAVDSGQREVLCYILKCGGNVHVTDNNGWTPLFRTVILGGDTCLAAELVKAGAEVDIVDRAGLSLPAAARLLRSRGGRRESLLRLVDAQFVRDKALAHFTRLTKKISSVQSLLK